MMALDMTAQLAPIIWGVFGLLLASTVGIVVTALPRTESRPQRTARPTRELRPVSASAAA